MRNNYWSLVVLCVVVQSTYVVAQDVAAKGGLPWGQPVVATLAKDFGQQRNPVMPVIRVSRWDDKAQR